MRRLIRFLLIFSVLNSDDIFLKKEPEGPLLDILCYVRGPSSESS